MDLADHQFRGGTLDESLTAACAGLRAHIGEIQYEIVEEDSDGVTVDARVDPVAVLGLFLSEAFRAGDLELQVRLSQGPEALVGDLSGSDLRTLTAGLGKGLDALQYLCNRVLNRRLRDHVPVHLDGDGYKDRRAVKLQDDAEDAADKAIQRKGPVTIGPYTPAARREIHLALADDPEVETYSDGEGFLKRVVIRPLGRR
ncbi:MAG: hypothetical protein DRQ48_04885 [Gammaproteobacteria bacterium]|nr:MAG: hypothetical protein DRQ48_04885 [Gammaproteobacteria bacterium]